MNWTGWHESYGVGLSLLRRLRIVRGQIGAVLDACGAGPIRIVSICGGDGRDVIEALADHPRRAEVTAFLLDTDAPSLERGRAAAREAGLDGQLRFVCADATLGSSYRGIVPADLILISGVLGHVSDASLPGFLGNLPMLCKSGGSVIWNRHLVVNRGAEHVALIREQLRKNDFLELSFEVASQRGFAVGRACFCGEARPLDTQRVIFEFVGLDRLLPENSAERELFIQRGEAAEGRGGAEQISEKVDATGGGISLPACFEHRVALHPDRPALGSGNWQPTYAELNHAANRIAAVLISRGGSQGDRVALLMPHDSPLVAAVLAVLKAGRVVVVLNPGDPPDRLAQVLDDARPGVILTEAAHAGLAAQIARGACEVAGVEDQIEGAPAASPVVPIDPHDVAFLVYSSGSTGAPKGVMQTHGHVLHKVRRVSRALDLQAEDKILLLASLSGGQGVNTTWCALAGGATLCPFPIMTRGVTGLAEWMSAHGITIYVSAASVFRHFVRTLGEGTRLGGTRLVWLASEPATSEDFAAWQRRSAYGGTFFHTLSSSETGVITQLSLSLTDIVSEGRLPVGRAVEGVEILLLDDAGREVPRGQTGEIAVRSRRLAAGYWRNDALTARYFSGAPEPDGIRMFRGGDRGRLTADGLLMFAGRQDSRVKIHGYRVELSEVEEALARVSGVDRALVLSQDQRSGDPQLVAYVTARPGHACTEQGLRRELRSVLPGYMIPSLFVFPGEFPFTPHGKIDRAQLRLLGSSLSAEPPGEPPVTETEMILAGIWSEIFEREAIGRRDDFFHLGGDSLHATVVAARVDSALAVRLDLRVFADHPTLAALAAWVDTLRRGGSPAVAAAMERVPPGEPVPLSFNQERIWKFSSTLEGAAAQFVGRRHEFHGPLDAGLLRESMAHLEKRHEILRTTFGEVGGRPVQIINPPAAVALREIDVRNGADPEAEALAAYRELSGVPFDLSRGPLLRFLLARVRDEERWLFRASHHINSDAWTWDVYFRELGQVYDALACGEKPGLPESAPWQYVDYAAWQRRVMQPDGPVFQETVSWWKERLGGGAKPLELPFRRSRPKADADAKDGYVSVHFDPLIARRIDAIGRAHAATPYVMRLAALAVVLAGETAVPDVVLGSYVTNRTRVETQEMLGLFANLATLRFRCDWQQTFRQWIGSVRNMTGEVQARCEIPYEHLCDELRAQGVVPPEIRLIFFMANRAVPVRFGAAQMLTPSVSGGAGAGAIIPWGFTIGFRRGAAGDGICSAVFDSRAYEPAGARAMMERLIRFLNAASLKPDRTLAELLAESAGATLTGGEPNGLERPAAAAEII